jgi:hypothetical protein
LIKRILLFTSEVALFAFGLFLSLVITIAADSWWSIEWALWPCLSLTIAGCVMFRRKTRPWKIEYDATGWRLSQVERKLHPARATYKRIASRILIWVPSATAAFVLFFYPVVTHLLHPSSRYLNDYRIPIPWTYAVWPGPPVENTVVMALASSTGRGRFGLTPFWDKDIAFSFLTFGTTELDEGDFAFRNNWKATHQEATEVLDRKFLIGEGLLNCRQYIPRSGRGPVWPFGAGPIWEVDCDTPLNVHLQNFYASFYGRQQDIPAFYEIIQGVTRVSR